MIKQMTMAVTVLMMVAAATASAQTGVYTIGAPGCDEGAGTYWGDLAPAETLSFEIDLTLCPVENLDRYYMAYGYIEDGLTAPQLIVGDGVDIVVEDLGTGFVTTGFTTVTDKEWVILCIDDPTTVLVSATNNNLSTVRVRLSWSILITGADADPDTCSQADLPAENVDAPAVPPRYKNPKKNNPGNGNGGNGNGHAWGHYK